MFDSVKKNHSFLDKLCLSFW